MYPDNGKVQSCSTQPIFLSAASFRCIMHRAHPAQPPQSFCYLVNFQILDGANQYGSYVAQSVILFPC